MPSKESKGTAKGGKKVDTRILSLSSPTSAPANGSSNDDDPRANNLSDRARSMLPKIDALLDATREPVYSLNAEDRGTAMQSTMNGRYDRSHPAMRDFLQFVMGQAGFNSYPGLNVGPRGKNAMKLGEGGIEGLLRRGQKIRDEQLAEEKRREAEQMERELTPLTPLEPTQEEELVPASTSSTPVPSSQHFERDSFIWSFDDVPSMSKITTHVEEDDQSKLPLPQMPLHSQTQIPFSTSQLPDDRRLEDASPSPKPASPSKRQYPITETNLAEKLRKIWRVEDEEELADVELAVHLEQQKELGSLFTPPVSPEPEAGPSNWRDRGRASTPGPKSSLTFRVSQSLSTSTSPPPSKPQRKRKFNFGSDESRLFSSSPEPDLLSTGKGKERDVEDGGMSDAGPGPSTLQNRNRRTMTSGSTSEEQLEFTPRSRPFLKRTLKWRILSSDESDMEQPRQERRGKRRRLSTPASITSPSASPPGPTLRRPPQPLHHNPISPIPAPARKLKFGPPTSARKLKGKEKAKANQIKDSSKRVSGVSESKTTVKGENLGEETRLDPPRRERTGASTFSSTQKRVAPTPAARKKSTDIINPARQRTRPIPQTFTSISTSPDIPSPPPSPLATRAKSSRKKFRTEKARLLDASSPRILVSASSSSVDMLSPPKRNRKSSSPIQRKRVDKGKEKERQPDFAYGSPAPGGHDRSDDDDDDDEDEDGWVWKGTRAAAWESRLSANGGQSSSAAGESSRMRKGEGSGMLPWPRTQPNANDDFDDDDPFSLGSPFHSQQHQQEDTLPTHMRMRLPTSSSPPLPDDGEDENPFPTIPLSQPFHSQSPLKRPSSFDQLIDPTPKSSPPPPLPLSVPEHQPSFASSTDLTGFFGFGGGGVGLGLGNWEEERRLTLGDINESVRKQQQRLNEPAPFSSVNSGESGSGSGSGSAQTTTRTPTPTPPSRPVEPFRRTSSKDGRKERYRQAIQRGEVHRQPSTFSGLSDIFDGGGESETQGKEVAGRPGEKWGGRTEVSLVNLMQRKEGSQRSLQNTKGTSQKILKLPSQGSFVTPKKRPSNIRDLSLMKSSATRTPTLKIWNAGLSDSERSRSVPRHASPSPSTSPSKARRPGSSETEDPKDPKVASVIPPRRPFAVTAKPMKDYPSPKSSSPNKKPSSSPSFQFNPTFDSQEIQAHSTFRHQSSHFSSSSPARPPHVVVQTQDLDLDRAFNSQDFDAGGLEDDVMGVVGELVDGGLEFQGVRTE
ncbi:hypothetical protein DL96DRAFT_1590092 [Flagelloscypha sp. PMI_526]|nr:hypothetical protein DL96DRAFT_1590092 [Flagelloscypha sp. PMI_526]